jgi:DNA-directed RNA polymerase specialized sigma24 family protein
MESDDPAQLDRVMARLAAGDVAYAVTLATGCARPIARLVRTLLCEMGRRDLARDRDEVAGLVLDACFVIADRAGGWRPGGASPWVWARFAIRAEVARSIGHRCVELDDHRHDEREPEPVDIVDYDELVERDARFASFDDVLRGCTSERDRRIVVEYVQQQSAGDPSPAITVGHMFGLEPATVRQVFSRAMRKVRKVLGDELPPSEGSRAA